MSPRAKVVGVGTKAKKTAKARKTEAPAKPPKKTRTRTPARARVRMGARNAVPAAPAATADFRQRVLAQLERAQALTVPPDFTSENRFFRDAWKSILEPSGRAPAFVGWWKELGATKNWTVDHAEVATGLKPERWTLAYENLSRLYAGIAGALFQYLRVQPVWKAKMLIGPQSVPGGAMGSEADIDKHHETQKKRLEELRKKMQAAYQKILDDIAAGLQEVQASLRADLQAIVALFRDLARVEHRRLEALAAQTPPPARQEAEAALERMREYREDAGPILPFSNTLMKWMQARTTARKAVGESTG